ncbi:MAG TPA: PQQ-dependent sugar dehydrogenase [Verrucomicrobiae bacterium]|jgi:glucose/arabinose dehydrogenase
MLWLTLAALARQSAPPETSFAGVAAAASDSIPPAEFQARLERGRELYVHNCFACHQFNGQGVPGVFPPLAKSDIIAADLARGIKAVVAGLSGEIVVLGKKFNGSMPPLILNDEEVGEVFTYVLNNWGNDGGVISSNQVRDVRSRTASPTFEKLQESSAYPPLPSPPEGFTLREVVRLTERGVRLASDGQGRVLYVLTADGNVFRVETASGAMRQVLWGNKYLITHGKDVGGLTFATVGMAMDKQKRLYICGNQQDISTPPVQNRVTIYRTTAVADGGPIGPKPWFWTNYPGSPAYIHGAENIAFGPDGFLYVGNGARTDGGQTGTDSTWYGGGETPITACIWRLDPAVENPTLEIFARGVRNAYGFCWDDKGEMLATENGPDADAPEELNLIERGKHYGFPYTFADWKSRKAYPHTPDAPPGLEFTLPIPNIGPDAGFDGKPMYTFDPHSSPAGIVYLGSDFPEGFRGTFLLARFGNFIRSVKESCGYDLLQAKLRRNAEGGCEAEIHTILAPLGRPLDVHLSGPGRVYICEYTRATNSFGSMSLPGRILELAVKPK